MRIHVREDDLMLGLDDLAGLGAGEDGSGSGVSSAARALVASLTPCALQAITDPSGAGNCAWNALRSLVEGLPDVQAGMSAIAYSDCASGLTALGLPLEVVSAVCAIPGVGTLWAAVQSRVKSELARIQGAAKQAVYEANYGRGRDRTAAEGGGHTLVDESGAEIGVACPGYVKDIIYDAAGNASVYVLDYPKDYPAGARCPESKTATKPGTVAITPHTIVKQPPKLAFVRPGQDYKSGGTAAVPWYRNKWTWIGGTVLVVGGVTIAVASRRRRH